MEDADLVKPCCIQRHFERGGDVLGLHRGAQLPGDDVAGEVVEDRRQVEPSPADDLEISEVRLPELVWCRRLVAELIRSLHHDEGRTGDQIMGLEQPINRGLRDKIAFGIGEAHGQFPRRQRRLVQRQVDDALTDIVGNAVPDAVRPGMSVVQSFWPTGPIQVVPTVEGGTRNANLFQGTPYRQGGLLDQPNDLKLLSGGVPHVASSPSAVTLFLSSRFSSVSSATTSFSAPALATQVPDLVRRRRSRRIAGQALLARLEKFLRPTVIEILDDPLAPAQLGDAVLAAQSFQHDADLVSAEKGRRVARRMVFSTCIAGSFTGPDFCLIFAPRKATMSQKSSLPQPAESVSRVLTADTGYPIALQIPGLQQVKMRRTPTEQI